MNLVKSALAYRRAGLCVLPAAVASKYTTLRRWKPFQSCLPNEQQVRVWFESAEALCVLTGKVSSNLEVLDFDQRAAKFPEWKELLEGTAPGLFEKLYVESTPSGGKHVAYRSEADVPGNQKLAQQVILAPDDKPVSVNGKILKPRKVGDHYEACTVLIETRGTGGLVLCAPAPGYVAEQGSLDSLPVLTAAERDVLLAVARALDERKPEPERAPVYADPNAGRPGDDFNRRGDVRALLLKHGWTLVKSGENEYWRRPGKSEGWSATLKNGVFYVFSSNAAPFESEKAYSPFSVFALLEHGGDFTKAAGTLRAEGYGDTPSESGVDLSGITAKAAGALQNEGNGGDERSEGVDLSGLLPPKQDLAALDFLTPKALFAYDTSDDPNTLLGRRWLCRGGACLLVGQTGIGKSSFGMQAAITWALTAS